MYRLITREFFQGCSMIFVWDWSSKSIWIQQKYVDLVPINQSGISERHPSIPKLYFSSWWSDRTRYDGYLYLVINIRCLISHFNVCAIDQYILLKLRSFFSDSRSAEQEGRHLNMGTFTGNEEEEKVHLLRVDSLPQSIEWSTPEESLYSPSTGAERYFWTKIFIYLIRATVRWTKNRVWDDLKSPASSDPEVEGCKVNLYYVLLHCESPFGLPRTSVEEVRDLSLRRKRRHKEWGLWNGSHIG